MKLFRKRATKHSTHSRRLELLRLEDRAVPAGLAWLDVPVLPASPSGAPSYIQPEQFRPITIDATELSSQLAVAPAEQAVWSGQAAGMVFTLPRPDGTTASFAVVDSPIMAPELAAQFPEIRTFAGQGIDDPSATIRMDISPLGFHAQVLSVTSGAWYIDPYYHLENLAHISYYSHDLPARAMPAEGEAPAGGTGSSGVGAKGPGGEGASGEGESGPRILSRSGQQLRTYRLAVAATGEYTQFHGGSVSSGQMAITAAVNRVVGVFEKELSIRMELIGNNSQLVYTNSSSDPYTNSSGSTMLGQNQSNIDSVIGNTNYDIGHVFSTGGGGVAGFGVVGVTGEKAKGVTGSSAPILDPFTIDYVAHEIGHQFRAEHTFNTSSDPNRNGSTAYEPGSGSTIMGYAGITGANSDLQPNSDPYFHSVSFDEIIAFVDTTIPGVGTRTSTGNAVPIVNAGPNYTIPTGTPFALTAVGSDANGDALTYNWEQRDTGPAQLLNEADNGSSPLFRSFLATTSPTRTFPRLSDVIANTTTPGELMYAQARTSTYRVTVRDNRAIGGGGVNTDDMVLNVVNTGTPFAVTAPNIATTWNGKSNQTITWSVAGTTANGINVANVRIRLSTDGGLTYPITLLSSTPNDGSQSIAVPNIDTLLARVRVEAVGNVFFDISNANFTINAIPGITVSPIAGLVTTEAGGPHPSASYSTACRPRT